MLRENFLFHLKGNKFLCIRINVMPYVNIQWTEKKKDNDYMKLYQFSSLSNASFCWDLVLLWTQENTFGILALLLAVQVSVSHTQDK